MEKDGGPAISEIDSSFSFSVRNVSHLSSDDSSLIGLSDSSVGEIQIKICFSNGEIGEQEHRRRSYSSGQSPTWNGTKILLTCELNMFLDDVTSSFVSLWWSCCLTHFPPCLSSSFFPPLCDFRSISIKSYFPTFLSRRCRQRYSQTRQDIDRTNQKVDSKKVSDVPQFLFNVQIPKSYIHIKQLLQ